MGGFASHPSGAARCLSVAVPQLYRAYILPYLARQATRRDRLFRKRPAAVELRLGAGLTSGSEYLTLEEAVRSYYFIKERNDLFNRIMLEEIPGASRRAFPWLKQSAFCRGRYRAGEP